MTAHTTLGLIESQAGTWIFEDRLNDNAPRAARAYALMSVAHHDAMVTCWDAKFAYWAIRPFQCHVELGAKRAD
jgi:hypothetical protein